MRRQPSRSAGSPSTNAATGSFVRLALALCAALSAAALLAAGASAEPVPIGTPIDGSGTPAGSMTPTKVAVDPTTGDLYVIDAAHDAINRFSSDGTYISQIKGSDTTAGSFAFFGQGSDALVVDPATGDLYVAASEAAAIFKFDSAGAEIWSVPSIHGYTCGIALDPDGDLWVGDGAGPELIELNKSDGSTTGTTIPITEGQPCQIDFDENGDVFVAKYFAGLDKWDAEGNHIAQCYSGNAGPAFDVATDLLTGDVYGVVLDSGTVRLRQWDNSCNQLASVDYPTSFSGNFPGVAVNGAARVVYAAQADQGVVQTYALTPTVVPLAPTNLAINSVTLNGTVNPGGAAVTDCHFDVSKDATFTTGVISVPCVPADLGTGTTPVPVSAEVTGLSANTLYHSRLVAANAAAPAETGDVTFKTKTQPLPIVITGTATAITQTGATFGGSVDPSGAATTCTFQYGTTTSYGSQIATADPGSGSDPVTLSATVTGLSPNTDYHFRLSCTNGGGTASGSDGTFKTASPPVIPPVINPPIINPPPPPADGRNEAAYKVCVKKAAKAFAKAKAKAKSPAASKAAKARKKKAIKKCAARFL